MKMDIGFSRTRPRPRLISIFPVQSRRDFASGYPEQPHLLRHNLRHLPLLDLEALAQLGEALPPHALEYNKADLPIGIVAKCAPNGLTIGETIRNIATTGSWVVLKNIEQVPAYDAVLLELLDELRLTIESRTGALLRPQGFVFISSPYAVTPYHFDPGHNILLQLQGTKVLTQFPAGDPRFAADTAHEDYHTGGGRELAWRDDMAPHGTPFLLGPGDAVFVPVMAPHHVRVGPQPSISLSITWRSEWSFAEADARAFNKRLRKMGLDPRAPGRWPATNLTKSLAHRLLLHLLGD